jgi:spoIIIJ-associated protein
MGLGVGREDVEVEVLNEGKPGFLGIGSEPARVRLRRIDTANKAASLAMSIVTRVIDAMGVSTTATLRSAHDPQSGGPVIDIQGDDSGLLIGRRGETMRALQFLVNLMVNKELEEQVRVIVDVESYRARREKALHDMALRVAEKVASSGRSIALEPMPPSERRVVHMALANNPRVSTESVGAGNSRKVTIIPQRDAR